MTQNDSNGLDLEKLVIVNNAKLNEFLEEDYEDIKNNSISPELNNFWNNFEKKINQLKKKESDDQILNLYIKLSENRSMLINKMDVIEPWFIKIEGFDCETGLPEVEIINSREDGPELLIELFKKQ